MNKLKSIIGLALIALALTFNTGCGTAPKRTYQTVSTAVITVDAAMDAWGHYVSQFHPPLADEQKVKDAFDKYRVAAIVVVDAGKAYASGSGSTKDLNAALAVAAASLGDLVNLIQAFGITIKTQ